MWENGLCFSLHAQTATQALRKVEKKALGWQQVSRATQEPTRHQLLRPSLARPWPGLLRSHGISRDFYCRAEMNSDISFSPFINITSSQCNYRSLNGMSIY